MMSKEELFKEAERSILNHDKDKAEEVAHRGLAEGLDPVEFITHGFREGITQIGDLFSRGEIFLPQLIEAAEAMKAANKILTESMPESAHEKRGKVVIGTVQGDIHDIGKFLVISLLRVNGFEVYDLGHDVEIQKFIEKALEVDADIIGTSALLTTTMIGQKTLEEKLRKEGLKDRFKTMVGGAPITQRWAERIGADAFGEDANDAVAKALHLTGSK
ncbi:MAG: B12-binding domain-containing protein [Candidatus Aminicenantes bacterium]|jgi:trimethylamine corrinoid protein